MFYDDLMRRFALERKCNKVTDGGYGTWIIRHVHICILVHYLQNLEYQFIVETWISYLTKLIF